MLEGGVLSSRDQFQEKGSVQWNFDGETGSEPLTKHKILFWSTGEVLVTLLFPEFLWTLSESMFQSYSCGHLIMDPRTLEWVFFKNHSSVLC